ncbi:BLUF domain-containing protein [Erythrobacter sp. BLCC-B19]|uniref:BLUF domain-containing protein n=1 Tax=Erythrobacter sp. BLCC-B19 TaxID=3025315 RepID=UPI00235EF06C|nr:BLUF domain-containing protein [Erythrobacter sp. BLCC-B19]WDA42298.1 BLUF domain-containing protein [Erythrobacter sp. BLCC-B19]
MRRIIYRSTASPDLDRAELFRLIFHARAANEARGLTGVLLRADQRLLQVLEGPTWKVIATFETIRRDLRHVGVAVIDERSIPQATFPDWPMRYFDNSDIAKAVRVMTAAAGGELPGSIAEAMRDFFVEAYICPESLTPSPPPAVSPSSPRPC